MAHLVHIGGQDAAEPALEPGRLATSVSKGGPISFATGAKHASVRDAKDEKVILVKISLAQLLRSSIFDTGFEVAQNVAGSAAANAKRN